MAAEDEDYVPEKAINGLQGWIDCFDGVELKKSIFIGGVGGPNQINESQLKQVYEIGRNV